MNIAGVEIGRDQPTRVVAELSNNHNGDIELALRLIRECAAAGADFIKFQCYTPDELVQLRGDGPAPDPWGSQGWSLRRLYEKAQTPHAWFPMLAAECRAVGVPWFSSVFGNDSFDLLDSLGCPAYKIAALDIGTTFAGRIGDSRRLGGLTMPLIASSANGVVPWADMTLWCPAGYPQNPSRFSYSSLRYEMAKHDGLSYHGTNWASLGMAAVYDAQLLECHVQLDDVPSELEKDVSLRVSDLRALCSALSR